MAKIILSQQDGPYSATIDTGAMGVTLYDTFLGVRFVTENGEELAVSMRDGGFEVHYLGQTTKPVFDAGWMSFKGGQIHPIPERRKTDG